MARPRPNTKSGKLIQWFPDFSGGLNTQAAVHQVADEEFVEGTNLDIDEQGAVSKRRGFSRITASLGLGRIQGLYLNQRFTSREMLTVHNGKLYKYDSTTSTNYLGTGDWVWVPIRRHSPVGVSATLTDAVTGDPALGPNLVVSTAYQYSVVAKDASGTTLRSDPDDPVSRVTQDATTVKKVVVTWYKVYGATGYDIYRNGFLITSVGDVSEWTDTGAVAQSTTEPPTTNTTEVNIPLASDVHFVGYNDRTFFTTGDGLCIFDGVFASLVTPYVPTSLENQEIGANALLSITSSIHRCRFIKLHWDRIFLSGDPSYPQNYYFTDLNLSPKHPQMYFPAFYAADVTTSNGSPITGMYNYRDSLVFFTESSIHALFGSQPDEAKPEPFIQRLIHPSIGCIAPKSIAVVGNVLVFISRLGVYALTNVVASNTALNIQLLSQKIQPTFKAMMHPEKAVAVFHDQQYRVCFPEDGAVFRWYTTRQAWTLDTAPQVSAYITVDNDLYMGSYNEGVVWKFGSKLIPDSTDPNIILEIDSYSDDGEAIPFYFRTKTFDMTAMVNLKKFRKLFLAARQHGIRTSLDLTGYIDYVRHDEHFEFNESTSFSAWELGKSRLGWVDVVTREIRFKGKGHQTYFEFRNEYINQPVTIYGLGIEFKIKTA